MWKVSVRREGGAPIERLTINMEQNTMGQASSAMRAAAEASAVLDPDSE